MRKRSETETSPQSSKKPEVVDDGDTNEASVKLTRTEVALALMERHFGRRVSMASSASGAATVGDVVRVTKGREQFSPVKYNTFEVGPLSFETQVRDGESISDAYARASVILEELFDVEFSIKLKAFHDHHETAMKRVVVPS